MAQEAQGIASLPMAQEVQRVTGGGQMARRQRPDIDPLLTEAQLAYLAGSFAPGAGTLEASGEAPAFPSDDMTVAEMLRGPRTPSLRENLAQGEYVDAALQGLGVLGDAAMAVPLVGPAASAALKGPRAFQRALQLASAKQLPADEMEGLYRTLVEIGYPEPTAAKIARGDLPMDEASRMARAREQGFNPDEPVYHGTANDIKSFEYAAMGARDPGFVGRGVYTTSEPKIAEFYASRAVPRGLDASGPNVMELLTRGGNYQQLSLEEKMRLGQAVRGNPEIAQNLTDELMSRGMIGAEVRDATGALVERANYNPSDIRSPRAAFDPEQIGSANILASPAAAGVGAAYLAAMQSRNENE